MTKKELFLQQQPDHRKHHQPELLNFWRLVRFLVDD